MSSAKCLPGCGCGRHRKGAESPHADNRPVLDRLAEKSHTVLATRCIVWNGGHKATGYGNISIAGKWTITHRAAWEAQRGPIPDGVDCLHDCPGGDNPACWNVDHLWLGTQGDNNADRDRKGRQVALCGEEHGNAKLTAEKVTRIKSDERPAPRIARDYGVSVPTIYAIKSGRIWGHLWQA